MQLVLALAELLALPDADVAPGAAPALARLLAAAGAPAIEDGAIATALAALYGVERQGDWPLAAIRLAALGVDPGGAYWLAADPVTLVAGRDDVRFAGAVADLGIDDANALIGTLNRHFSGDGLVFTAPRPDAFFVRVDGRVRITTRPPAAASGASLRTLEPVGADAETWRRWQSEIQMLLHEHPVNAARERAGRPPANSLWFSSGGTRPPRRVGAPSIRTFAGGGIAAALAAHVGSPARELPARLESALAEAAGAARIVVALDAPLDLAAIDTRWAAPAGAALAAGRLDAVTLLTDAAGKAISWRAQRPPLWKRLAGRFARHDLAALLAAARRDDPPRAEPS